MYSWPKQACDYQLKVDIIELLNIALDVWLPIRGGSGRGQEVQGMEVDLFMCSRENGEDT